MAVGHSQPGLLDGPTGRSHLVRQKAASSGQERATPAAAILLYPFDELVDSLSVGGKNLAARDRIGAQTLGERTIELNRVLKGGAKTLRRRCRCDALLRVDRNIRMRAHVARLVAVDDACRLISFPSSEPFQIIDVTALRVQQKRYSQTLSISKRSSISAEFLTQPCSL